MEKVKEIEIEKDKFEAAKRENGKEIEIENTKLEAAKRDKNMDLERLKMEANKEAEL